MSLEEELVETDIEIEQVVHKVLGVVEAKTKITAKKVHKLLSGTFIKDSPMVTAATLGVDFHIPEISIEIAIISVPLAVLMYMINKKAIPTLEDEIQQGREAQGAIDVTTRTTRMNAIFVTMSGFITGGVGIGHSIFLEQGDDIESMLKLQIICGMTILNLLRTYIVSHPGMKQPQEEELEDMLPDALPEPV